MHDGDERTWRPHETEGSSLPTSPRRTTPVAAPEDNCGSCPRQANLPSWVHTRELRRRLTGPADPSRWHDDGFDTLGEAMTYAPPRTHLHRSFLYLDHDAVMNSLAMLEPDWTMTTTATRRPALSERPARRPRDERSAGGRAPLDPVHFAAFDAWQRHLEERHAFGTFDTWGEDVRNSLEVGHTLRFQAQTVLSPLVKLIMAMVSFAADRSDPDSFLDGDRATTERNVAQMRKLDSLLKDADGTRGLSMYLDPPSGSQPRIVARLHERYLAAGLNQLEGEYEVIVQVESLLRRGEAESIVRLMRSGTAMPIESEAIAKLAPALAGTARKIGVELSEGDVTFTYPTVFVQPIAIYR
jgi:hypothetical protein